ncbi:MAG: hypothetical protein ACI9HK_005036 [Pirellulaceae bacterium]|jgi:hypothetical protein
MSTGPMGMIGSAAGTHLSQTKGSDTQRAQQDTETQQRQVDSDKKAENAAGLAEADQQSETSERDADGRKLWESQTQPNAKNEQEDSADSPPPPPQSKDPAGVRGNNLDLSG